MTTVGAERSGWGLDVGTSSTVLASHESAAGPTVVAVPGHGRPVGDAGGAVPAVSVVPSVIHYADDGRRLVGEEVLAAGLLDAAGTVRGMTSYVGRRSPGAVEVGGRLLTHAEVGGDFLAAVLGAGGAPGAEGGDVVLAVPVETAEHYGTWLRQAAAAAALPPIRLADEPSAAAVGYGLALRPGQVFMLVDCGASSVRAAVVRVTDQGERAGGRACRVLGRGHDDVGGATIDGWLAAEVLARHGLDDDHEAARSVAEELLAACERAKHELSVSERARIAVTRPDTGADLDLDLVRSGPSDHSATSFEELLERHDLVARLDRVVRDALRGASERGYGAGDVAEVLVVGGTVLVPAVRRTIERVAGHARVHADRPLDAVALGAAALAVGVGPVDQVRHDYALRCYDRARGRYEFRTCVAAGTPYPTDEPVATVVLKASHDGQRELGVAVFELGESRGAVRSELVLDASGGWRLEALTPSDEQDRTRVWVNERNPTYLVADPPAQAGEARFRVELGVDADRRLVLTAHDLVTRETVLRDHPVVDLR